MFKQCAILILSGLLFSFLLDTFEEGFKLEKGIKTNEATLWGYNSNETVIDLSGLNIEKLECQKFLKFQNLRILYLNSNRISHIEDNCFESLTKLKVLDLSSNQLQTISELTFAGLVNIDCLILSNNNISFIHANAFERCEKSTDEMNMDGIGYHTIRLHLNNNPIFDLEIDNGIVTKFC